MASLTAPHAHSKKGIVILTSEMLFVFQMNKHSEAKMVCVRVWRKFIKNAENTLAMSISMQICIKLCILEWKIGE